jgi:alpha-D-ribose 1-methylphosphonate 5-triphosphate synthase subunit PhnH
MPGDVVAQRAENRARFPRGVDLLLVASGEVIGLPRTTRVEG